jgi:hypothetical protein
MVISLHTKRFLNPTLTLVSDRLTKQQPPSGCSREQWATYVATVRENELRGVPNPEFGVPKPWERCCSSRQIKRGR